MLFIKLIIFIGSIIIGSIINRVFLRNKRTYFYSVAIFLIGFMFFNINEPNYLVQVAYTITFGLALGLNSDGDGYTKLSDKLKRFFIK